MPPQDKAELFRLAFMAGTKQARLGALEAPDNTFPFHAAAAAEPQVFQSPHRGSGERQGTPVSGGEGRDNETGGISKLQGPVSALRF